MLQAFHFLLHRRSSILQDIYFYYRIRRFVSELIFRDGPFNFCGGGKGGGQFLLSMNFFFCRITICRNFISPKLVSAGIFVFSEARVGQSPILMEYG